MNSRLDLHDTPGMSCSVQAVAHRRRALLAGMVGTACSLLLPKVAAAHDHRRKEAAALATPGRPERARVVAPVPLIMATGLPADLLTLTQGHATAVQLMFTGCSATCQTQGALFAEVQTRISARGQKVRLLSISIDPPGDDPKSLSAWLQKFRARSELWTGAVPPPEASDRLTHEFRACDHGDSAIPHWNRVFVFNASGCLSWATGSDPSPKDVMEVIDRHG